MDGEIAVCLGYAVLSAGLYNHPGAMSSGYFHGIVGALHIHNQNLVDIGEAAQAGIEIPAGIVGVYDAGYGCAFAHFFFRENMFLKRRRLMSLCWWAL